jgi:hypothetical protein
MKPRDFQEKQILQPSDALKKIIVISSTTVSYRPLVEMEDTMNKLYGDFGKWTDETGRFIDSKELKRLLGVDTARIKSWINEQYFHNEHNPMFFEQVCFQKMAALWRNDDTLYIADIPAHLVTSDPLRMEMVGRVRVIMDISEADDDQLSHVCLAVIEREEERVIKALRQSIQAIDPKDN